ncbi:hypothetical protein LCGC14_2949740, partial [marine sediment metagenome]
MKIVPYAILTLCLIVLLIPLYIMVIGSFTNIILGKMGFKKFWLYDHDKIETHNLVTQFYNNDWIGNY